jgi:hypothetical protein
MLVERIIFLYGLRLDDNELEIRNNILPIAVRM